MKTIFPLLFLIMASIFTPSSGQSYEQLWTKVTAAQEKDLPRDVLSATQTIYDKAKREKNFPQLLKSWVTLIETKSEIDPDSFKIASIEPLPHHGAVQTAIYNAIMASAHLEMTDSYGNYLNQDNQAEAIQKADSLYKASLSDFEALHAESAQNYLPLITEGKDSRLYDHDLLSLLARFAFDHSLMTHGDKADLSKQLADFYLSKGNREAYTLLKLEHLKQLKAHEDYNLRLLFTDYKQQLHSLLEASTSCESYADVAQEYVDLLSKDEQYLFCKQFLAEHSKAFNAAHFQSIIDNYKRPLLNLTLANNLIAGQPNKLSLSYSNLTTASFTVRKFNGYKDKHESQPRLDGEVVLSKQFALATDSLNQARLAQGLSTTGQYKEQITLPVGHYVFVTNGAGGQDIEEFRVTSLRLLLFYTPEMRALAIVVDNQTGRPVPGAYVHVNDNVNHRQFDVKCDARGEALIDTENHRIFYYAYLQGTDDRTSEIAVYSSSKPSKVDKETYVRLFTDRAIYRPKQTVHLSGISYSQQGDETWTNPSRSLTFKLYDVNHQEVSRQTAVTNDLGSFDLDFVLPEGLLPGQFTIQGDNNSSVRFRVEEYKRPTFQVEARHTATDGRTFTFGDTIQVEATAKTYADVPVQGAKVHYKIETAKVEFWRWWTNNWELLSEADTLTSDQGIAQVPLFLNPQQLEEWDHSVVRYRVTFEVTDLAGETHSASYEFSLSRKAFSLSIEGPKTLDLSDSTQQLMIKAINANHEPVNVTGQYSIFAADAASDAPALHTGSFQSDQPLSLPVLSSGSYRIEATSADINVSSDIAVYDPRQALLITVAPTSAEPTATRQGPGLQSVTAFTSDFGQVVNSTFSEEKPAEVFFAPSMGDTHIGYMLMSNDKLILHRQLTTDRQLLKFRVPYRTEYGQAVSLLVYYVRNGHLFYETYIFKYEQPDKRLLLSWSTFRDRLYPGQQEEWVLNITDPAGQPVPEAELLATMYDASLDAITPHSWYFSLSFPRKFFHTPSRVSPENPAYRTSLWGSLANRNYAGRVFDELTAFVHDSFSRRMQIFFHTKVDGVRPMLMNASPVREKVAFTGFASRMTADSDLMEANFIAQTEESIPDEETNASEEKTEVQLRSNFAETALFLPHLRSDKQGQFHIAFTLPESLTEWKFMALAHDREVRYGTIYANTVARKDFMVQPNMPRFLREGDQATIAARVINMSERTLQGKVQLRLLDAQTDEVIVSQQLPFSTEANQTTAVSFCFETPASHPLLVCEVVASLPEASAFMSDGERHLLPVLSSRRYITEAVPFYITHADSSKQVDVSSLFNQGSPTATQRRLVLEYTQHPEWYVIEALDGIKLPEYDNAPAFAASLYANLTASRLAQSIPGFEAALTTAAQSTGVLAKDSLFANSPLFDEDLKELLLRESPWVADALRESDQRTRLLDLFDKNLIAKRTSTALERLQSLQLRDGSWSWFKGMEGSYHITLSVCEQLIGLCAEHPEVNLMVNHALTFLDKEELERYNAHLRYKSSILTESTLHYLYVCSMMPDRYVSSSVKKMRSKMLKELSRSVRSLTILGRAQAACILRAFGYDKVADDFVESAVQYTISKPGQGRYYVTDQAYYSWRDYRMPTQLAAMRAIQASHRADRQQLLADMQIWLLRQKQGQQWDNPLNTLGAVQQLLSSNTILADAPAAEAESVVPSFTLGNTPLAVSLDTTRLLAPQLGYIHTELPDDLTTAPLSTLTITTQGHKSESPISWGALYAQCFDDLESLHAASAGELSVSFHLLDANGHELQLGDLHVGDLVTMRIVVKSDRDLDFIQVRAQHPACFEPTNQLSGYRWMGGLGGYVAHHDASTDLFFDTFRRGTVTFDLTFHVDRPGEYVTGIVTAQCAYTPEFTAHSQALRLNVKP